jgi:hypothetical protein
VTEPAAAIGPVLNPLTAELRRIADQMAPPQPDIVGTAYVAGKLGLGSRRISQMAAGGEIPADCLVPGTGHGREW